MRRFIHCAFAKRGGAQNERGFRRVPELGIKQRAVGWRLGALSRGKNSKVSTIRIPLVARFAAKCCFGECGSFSRAADLIAEYELLLARQGMLDTASSPGAAACKELMASPAAPR